ncbi:MAG TPA: PRC-barrel domain-containing protein, partial [Rhodospirillales bacterium]|nr:PRC-barrel domain-containing protein [Rhodospirillales bacterium]
MQPAVDVAGGEEPESTAPTKHLRTIPTDEAAGVLGKRVIGAAGEDIGMVVDVLIDNTGRPRAAVVDFGGFLGVGTRKIAVDWTFLQFRPGDRNVPVLLDVTGDAIRAAPEYRPSDAETSVVSPPAEDDGGDADTPAPAAGEPADDQPAADGTPAPKGPEEAKPPTPSAEGRDRRPLPEMKPPEGR